MANNFHSWGVYESRALDTFAERYAKRHGHVPLRYDPKFAAALDAPEEPDPIPPWPRACRGCERPMRPGYGNTRRYPGTVKHHAHDVCVECAPEFKGLTTRGAVRRRSA